MTPDNALGVLRQARLRYSQRELADLLGVNESTYRRWEVKSEIPSYRHHAILQRCA